MKKESKQKPEEQENQINFSQIEKKWQDAWEKSKIFKAEDNKGKKYYVLEMYPYPSASFLHVGHVRNYTIGDVFARYKRMNGFNVLYPIGYDSFGLPAETASKKEGIHPKIYAEKAIKKIMEYQKALGNSYDWSRVIASHEPEYYKWNQYFFLKLLEHGLAYRKKAPVNYCNHCQSVLANEEAESGKCWRCGKEVQVKEMEQWFFKITDYADKLLNDLDKIQWSEKIKTMQRNWIGKSEGTEILFEIENKNISNVVIVHGFAETNDTLKKDYVPESQRSWRAWIKNELEKESISCVSLQMPSPWEPKYLEWKREIERVKIDENSILVGHSAGGGFLVRWLHETKKEIKKLILVSPGKSNRTKRQVLLEFYGNGDYTDIKNLVKDRIIIFTSEEDLDYHIKIAKEYGEELGAKVIKLGKGYGHFNSLHMKTPNFPELLEEIISNQKWPIFTTRPDTIYGVTFMVISSQHPKLLEITTEKQKKQVEIFIKKCQKAKTPEEQEKLDKEGVFTGSYAINPITKDKVPIWAGNFVLADYGSGMVMAVPCHDQRDFEFAKKYKIPMKEVIQPKDKSIEQEKMKEAYVNDGILVNSQNFNNIDNRKAIEEITKYLEKQKLGKKTTNYKIRDWLISRQRYWGTPIPIVYCEKCGIVPIPYEQLPVLLPEKIDFKVSGNPLAYNKEFIETICPKCQGKAKRETDTLGGFMDSSWYFLRYCDSQNKTKPFDSKKVDYWMPVDQYIGGIEHAVGHLMYARFLTKFLKDIKMLNFDEPFTKLFNQGIVYKDGKKMSKSYSNVVFQTEISEKYGIDTARLFLMFVSSPDKQMEWSNEGIEGSFRIINRLIRLKEKISQKNESNHSQENKIHSTIKKVSENIENFEYPKAIIPMTECLESLSESISKENYEILLKLFHPFCPHITEELWHNLGNKTFLSLESWPKFQEHKINEKLEQQEQAVEKTIQDINNIIKMLAEKKQFPKKVFLYTIPNELDLYKNNLPKLQKSINIPLEIFAVNDKNKIDPQNKAGKAKPGKPAIYLE